MNADLSCSLLALLASTALADHNAVQLDKMVLSLPKGWEVRITRPDHLDPTGNKALFAAEFTFPSVEYEYESRAGRLKMSPTLTLSFYEPFTSDQLAQYERKAEEIRSSERAVAPPIVFVKTENYWVFTYHSGAHFRHPKEKEIYQHLREFLSINRKE